MSVFRSLVCQLSFYLNFLCFGALCPIILVLPKPWVYRYAITWKRVTMWLWRFTTNSTIEIRGIENLPKGGYILASKHQSTWETLALGTMVPHVVFIMKREILYLPIFGWFAWRTGMIPIARGKRGGVMQTMIMRAKEAVVKGYQIIIFMEGTRVSAGKKGQYKTGVARLYQSIECPIVPVALNAGLFWPRNAFWRHSGKIIVQFLPPIMPGKTIKQVMTHLEQEVEAASNQLLIESATGPSPPPTMKIALDELKSRGVKLDI